MSRTKFAVILHWIIVITTFTAIACYFFGNPDSLCSTDASCFKYFTTDSNVLAAIASVVCLVSYYTGKRTHPVELLQFVGTVAVTVTFVTVVLFLAPVAIANSGNIGSGLAFFENNVFVLHFSTPVLSIIALLLTPESRPLTLKEAVLGVIPVFVYSIVYLVLVVYVGIWYDWYGFTFGGHNEFIPVVILVMYLATFALSLIERKFHTLADRAGKN